VDPVVGVPKEGVAVKLRVPLFVQPVIELPDEVIVVVSVASNQKSNPPNDAGVTGVWLLFGKLV
jgi:hypothetical protein